MDKPIAILYSTWHGQAEKIAKRIADVAYVHGVRSTIANIAGEGADDDAG